MSCARCEDLCRQVPIRTPGELEKVALVAKANLDDGTIVEIARGAVSRAFSTLMGDRPLPDQIRADFRCTECDECFSLRCESYHGSGGNWSHKPASQKSATLPDHLCPACGYILDFPTWNSPSSSDEICPCCGIQFGYDDGAGGNPVERPAVCEQWRGTWIANGMKWFSKGRRPKAGWDANEQLKRISS
jgi:hypothetical protein